MNQANSTEVCVVVVSDYIDEEATGKSWDDERAIVQSLAKQDFKEPFDVLLIENTAFADIVPPDLKEILPDLQIVFSQADNSAELKNCGVNLTSSPIVAVLEADCVPNERWLRVMVDVLRKRPEVWAVSGRTIYGTNSIWERCFSVLDRGYMDPGASKPITNLSNNSALYRRELLKQYPYRGMPNPFIAAAFRLDDINRDGYALYFEPRAVVVHAFGWKLERDLRRNRGLLHMITAGRSRPATLLKIPLRKLRREALHLKRVGRHYLRWYDWPAAVLLLVVVRFLEIPGMIDALRNRQVVPGTSYR